MESMRQVGTSTRRRIMATLASLTPVFLVFPEIAYPQDKTGFPDGYDAVEAAPNSHRVIFENALVRVLEVTVPLREQPSPCITIVGRVSS